MSHSFLYVRGWRSVQYSIFQAPGTVLGVTHCRLWLPNDVTVAHIHSSLIHLPSVLVLRGVCAAYNQLYMLLLSIRVVYRTFFYLQKLCNTSLYLLQWNTQTAIFWMYVMIFNHISESVGIRWSEVALWRWLGLTHIGWMACRGAQRMNPNDSADFSPRANRSVSIFWHFMQTYVLANWEEQKNLVQLLNTHQFFQEGDTHFKYKLFMLLPVCRGLVNELHLKCFLNGWICSHSTTGF